VPVRGILYWARAEGESADAPAALGTAWVIEADGTVREINNGDPITRAEAVRLATAGEYMLDAEP
jgi:hypothetical protein